MVNSPTTKAELVRKMDFESKYTQKVILEIINSLLVNVQEELSKDKNVQFIGFGTFEIRERAARKGRNSQTGEHIDVKPSKTIGFKAEKLQKRQSSKYISKSEGECFETKYCQIYLRK